MKILDKICDKNNDLYGKKPVTIAFLGDSVTQGCFECFFHDNGAIDTVFDEKNAYPERVKQLLNLLYPRAQINVVNSGISGDNAVGGNSRFDRDITPYRPDLVVVAFGLNDFAQGKENVTEYTDALGEIFDKVKNIGAECIFLAQNTVCRYASCRLPDERHKNNATWLAGFEDDGTVEYYFDKGKETALSHGVAVCDMYSKWKRMYEKGVDVTELLANRLNHPIREMHYYTAIELIETMFKD